MTASIDQVAALSPAQRELFERLRALADRRPPAAVEPIAIIGMGCRFPGAVDDPDSYWELLSSGRDAVTEVPADRWENQEWYDRNPATPGKMATRQAAFLDQVDLFDAEFFGISPREAAYVDPQHRLLLETAWEALEHAGVAPDRLHGSPTGVYLGLGTLDYYRMAFSEAGRVGPYCATGTFASAGAGRISYTLGLQGPSLAIDTACSSSLVAVHYACQGLRLKECSLALAGGVSLMIGPELSVGLTKAHMLAADGRCKTFDASADGYGRGEGCGVVVLKTLADAERDGDFIWGVIAGSAVNQDGRSNGLTAPNGPAQEALLRSALKSAGVCARDVTYVEAHGTGTALGDPIEVGALARVLGEGRPVDRPLVIGSAKTNIGHLELAAGIAGLIKTVLCLKHRQIPPNLHFQTMNPGIAAVTGGVPIHVPTEVETWVPAGESYVAGVSSFGFGGTNAHVLVTAPPDVADAPVDRQPARHVLCLSAKSSAALRELTKRYLHALSRNPAPIGDVCFTANTGRAHFDCRLALVAASATEFSAKLADWLASNAAGDHHSRAVARRIVLLLPGGSATCESIRALYEAFVPFRQAVDRCLELLAAHERPVPLRDFLFGRVGEGPGALVAAEIALFVMQVALGDLLKSWRIIADCVLADRNGAAAAVYLAGGVSLDEGLKLAACCAALRQSNATAPVDAASAAEFAKSLKNASLRPLTGRLVTTAAGRDATDADLTDPAFWLSPQVSSDRVREALWAVAGDATTACLELGPGAEFCAAAKRALGEWEAGANWLWLSTFSSEAVAAPRLLEALADLYRHLVPVDWPAFYGNARGARVALPTYPFQRERHWLDGDLDRQPKNGRSAATTNGESHSNGKATSNGKAAALSAVAGSPAPAATLEKNGKKGVPRMVAASSVSTPAVPSPGAGGDSDHLRKLFEDCLIRALELPEDRRIPPDQDLLDLGMDSITALEMLFSVEKSLGRPLRMPGITKSRTINQFIALVQSCAGADRIAPAVR